MIEILDCLENTVWEIFKTFNSDSTKTHGSI